MTSRTPGAVVLFMLAAVPALAGQAPPADPKAFLRVGTDGHYVALVLDPPAAAGTTPDQISAAVFRNGRLLTRVVRAGDSFGAAFTMPLGNLAAFGGDARGLSVTVSSYPTQASGLTGGFAVPVSLEVQAAINPANPSCDASSLGFQISSNVNRDPTPYEAERLKVIGEYLGKNPPTAESELRTGVGTRKHTFDVVAAFELSMLLTKCFRLDPDLGPGTYDLKLSFTPAAPVELQPFMLKTGLAIAAHKNAPLSTDGNQVGKRSIEENLDLGVLFGSSVAKDSKGVSTRTTKATLDLRFAPLLNLVPLPDESDTFKFFTPFFLDARVSTGDVTKETLSQNRIVFGSDFEIRHYTNPTTYPTYQRWIISFRNASDRDFKQAEWKGVVELQPVFSALNKPLAWQEETEPSQLDPTQGPKRIVKARFGRQVIPILGFEAGHTWRNELPAAAIEKTENVWRFYVGGTAAFDLTRYATVSFRELLYVRGESDTDRAHNYFLAKAEIPIAGFSATTAQAIFFAYERGGLPPYSTPDVDAIKLGYRLLWNGWAQQFR